MKAKKITYVLLLIFVLMVFCAFSFDRNHGDSLTIFNSVTIGEGDIVTGDAITVFGNTDIRGEVRGDVVAVFGNVDIYGKIGGDVVSVFGNVDIHSNAVVSGDAMGVLGNVNKANGAIIRGESVDTSLEFMPKNFDIMPSMSFGSIIAMMILYGLCCLVVLIIPDRVMFIAKSSQFRIGRSFIIGILVVLVMLLLTPLLILTIIGIIPAVLLIFGFIAATLISSTAVYIALGQRIAAAVEGRNAIYIHLLIGVVVVYALQMIPIVGIIASMAVFLIGLGVAFDTRLGGALARKKA